MRDDDDSPLAGIDLAAWQPPPPPAGLADAVIPQVREPAAVAAMEASQASRSSQASERAPRRGLWLAAVAAVAALTGGIAVWGVTRAPRAGGGERIAARPDHLDLGGTVADLDAGAELRWTRDGRRITAHQRRGTVRWTVADDDTLVIDPGDAGSSGATSTIEASGASLRVEVSMNLVDTRMIGAMTGSAVVAALVTATVYQGHIRATSGGQTVQIEPGATVELRAAQPPQPPAHADEPRTVGGAADALALQARLAAADKQVAELTARLTVGDDPRTTAAIPTVPPAALDKLRLSGERQIVPDGITREAMEMAGNRSLVGLFRLCVDVHGAISSVSLIKSTRFDRYDQTILRGIRDWKYRPFLVDGKPAPVCTEVTYLYTTDSDPPGHATKACDNVNLDDELTQAANQYSMGLASSALTILQGALTCRQDARTYRFAALYACAAHDAPAAREMFAKLPAAMQPAIEQRCQQEAIDVRGREP